ncbi:cytochrome P450 [Macrolepiota fuliginosa MF-IS2]|uniref:Cytochrome P450 n=1 Tax=Macrolepiota fuliginosa MF-IS2 TaxID=1400762 RepID=A0A9P6C3T8_9AGAR|nr:cytochrome P450 [Macrolepiota fuliginosa MF-IS2]
MHKTRLDSLEEGEESFLLVHLCVFGSLLYFLWLRRDRANYKRIPAVGFSGTLASSISLFRYLYNPTKVLKKAYLKFPGGIFRCPTLTRWIVVIAKTKYVEELRKAPEDDLSASEAMKEILQLAFTVDSGLLANSELKSLLGAQLARNLPQALLVMHTEMLELVNEYVPSEEDGWKYIEESELIMHICNRVINRALVGASLSQNPEFTDLVVTLTNNLERYARKLRTLPALLRPLFVLLFTPLPRIKRRMRALLSKTLKERQELLVKRGDSFPNDMITWFVSHDTKSEMPIDELVAHVMLVNYLAVQPMAKVMSQALRNLAQYPRCTEELRAEVDKVIRREGWSKSGIDKLYKLDSFLRETMRLNETTYSSSYPNLNMARKTIQPITFSDGITIPSNTLLFVGSQLLHMDARYYSKPETFEPFRFIPSSFDDDSTISSQISPSMSTTESFPLNSTPPVPSSAPPLDPPFVPVSSTLPATSPTFLAWGHGKHACPGRFFAAFVMKLMLAHLVLEFDFRVPPSASSISEDCNDQERNSEAENKDKKILWIEVKRRQPRTNPNL